MISVENLEVEFSARPLFQKVSFVINPKDRIALVGKNGAGKSTLMKILAGLQAPTSGVVAVPKETTIGYLPQVMVLSDTRTVREEAELAFEHISTMRDELDRMNVELAERTDYESEGTDDNVNDGELLGIKTIKQGAISLGCKELTLPESFVSLKRGTIAGSFKNIIFRGQLQEIEKGALDKVYNRDGDCTLKINGLLSNINNEGKEELRIWYNFSTNRHKVVFATPQPNGHILENGFIELSEVLSMSDKINYGLDTRAISINADINMGIVRRGEEEQEISNVPIIIREVSTGEASYKSMPITQISFATNKEILLFVYERYEDVKRMIQQSYKGKK